MDIEQAKNLTEEERAEQCLAILRKALDDYGFNIGYDFINDQITIQDGWTGKHHDLFEQEDD